MKQFSFCVDEAHPLSSCLSEFLQACPAERSSILALVFTSQQKSSAIWEMLDEIRSRVPDAQVAGATSGGEIVKGCLHRHATALSFLVFEKANVRIFAYDFDKIHLDDIGAILLGQCRSLSELSAIGLLGALEGGNVHPLMEILSQLPEKVEVFGCGATACDEKGLSYVFAQEMLLRRGLVSICLEGAGLKLRADSQLGWRPLGHPMKITDIFSGNIISKLDGMPAVSVYKRYLGIQGDDNFAQEAMSFPLLLKRNGDWLARIPDACTRDGSLVFSTDFQLGEQVWLSYGDPNEIRRLSHRMGKVIRTFSPEAVLAFSCASRRQFLHDNVNLELSALPEDIPSAGLYSREEILRRNGRIELLHSSMIAVSLREAESACPPASLPDEPGETVRCSTAERLAIFIQALAEESPRLP